MVSLERSASRFPEGAALLGRGHGSQRFGEQAFFALDNDGRLMVAEAAGHRGRYRRTVERTGGVRRIARRRRPFSGERRFTNRVTKVNVVPPSTVDALNSGHRVVVTLVTCTRDLKNRLLVVGELVAAGA